MNRKMPRLHALRAFEVAGMTGSFTRAAELLNVTQSAVSRQVRQLELQLGEPLLIRRHHHLQPTDAGRALLRALQQSFDQIEQALGQIRQQAHLSRLRVNAPPTFAHRWLLPRLERLRQQNPDMELTLTTRLEDALTENAGLDCAIRFGNGEWSGVDCALLMNERHIAVCAPALLARHGGKPDLHNMRLLHVLASEDQRFMTWRHWLAAAGIHGVDLQAGYEFDLLDLAIRAAINGQGITIADRQMVAQELSNGQLRQVLDVQVDGHQSYWWVQRPGQQLPPYVDRFRTWLASEARAA